MKKKNSLSVQVKSKNFIVSKVFFSTIVCLLVSLLLSTNSQPVHSRSRSKTKTKKHSLLRKHKRTKEEDLAAKEAAAREAREAKLIEGKNIVLAKAYRLYDSGTSENLQGNYKYSILQLKLADELLQEHGQANSSLAIATLMGLGASAQAAKEYSLAKSTYERLLSIHPNDNQLLLNLAKVEAAQSNFNAAQININKVLELSPANAEAKLLADFVANKAKPVKRCLKTEAQKN